MVDIRVRRATVEDVPRLAAVLARAYEDDPLMSWYVPDPATRRERLRRFYGPSLRRMVARSLREVFTTDELSGAAVWAAPGLCRLPTTTMLPAVPAMVGAIGGGVLRRMRAYNVMQAERALLRGARLRSRLRDRLARGGPHMWRMWRRPGARHD